MLLLYRETQHNTNLHESPEARETSSERQNRLAKSSTAGFVASLLFLREVYK